MRDKWYESAYTLKHKVRHLRNHRRLGPSYTKCGKRLGESCEDETLAPCQVCEAELLMEGKGSFPHSRTKDLRDYFAAHAASSLVAECQGENWASDCANVAYILADAMMAEREKRA
jgi:hypothetical protein